MKTVLFAALGVAAGLVVVYGVGIAISTRLFPVPPVSTERAHIGDHVRVGNWEYSVLRVDRTKTLDNPCDIYFDCSPKPSGVYIIVVLELTNQSLRSLSIYESDFELRDDRDRQDIANYSDMAVSKLRKQEFSSGPTPGAKIEDLRKDLPSATTIRTALVFDVPPEATGMYMFLTNGRRSGSISLD